MIGTGQDSTLLIVTNVALGIVCALFWLWIVAVVSVELYKRWRIRASLPRGWPPVANPVVPDAWPPFVKPAERSRVGGGHAAGRHTA